MKRLQCIDCGGWHNHDETCPYCQNQKQEVLFKFL
tara:strand:+ start:11980 stop:12084 length:105 start_codon:yes stop_codon:yes gene_type:complete